MNYLFAPFSLKSMRDAFWISYVSIASRESLQLDEFWRAGKPMLLGFSYLGL